MKCPHAFLLLGFLLLSILFTSIDGLVGVAEVDGAGNVVATLMTVNISKLGEDRRLELRCVNVGVGAKDPKGHNGVGFLEGLVVEPAAGM